MRDSLSLPAGNPGEQTWGGEFPGEKPSVQKSISQPSFILESEDAKSSERRDQYLSFMHSGSLPQKVKIRGEVNINLRIETWHLPNLTFTKKLIRSPARVRYDWNILDKRLQEPKDFKLHIILSGIVNGVFDGKSVQMKAGDVYMVGENLTYTRYTDANPRGVFSTTFLPLAVVKSFSNADFKFKHFAAETPTAIMLRGLVDVLASSLPRISDVDATELANKLIWGTTALLSPVSEGKSDASDLAQARVAAVQDFISRTIGPRPVDIGALCKKFGMSRATLYRDFAPYGGVKRYIDVCKLKATYRELSIASGSRGIVQDIAERWGYADPGHFSRSFRAYFGVPPSYIVGQSASSLDTTDARDSFLQSSDTTVFSVR